MKKFTLLQREWIMATTGSQRNTILVWVVLPLLLCSVEPLHAWTTKNTLSGATRRTQTEMMTTASSPRQQASSVMTMILCAKRNRRGGAGRYDGDDDMNSWYDSVDDDATPDKVFWQEMERQRQIFMMQF